MEELEENLSLVWVAVWEMDWEDVLLLPCRDSATGTAALAAWLAKLANKSALRQTFAEARRTHADLDNITVLAIFCAQLLRWSAICTQEPRVCFPPMRHCCGLGFAGVLHRS